MAGKKPLDIPLERPVASGELVDIRDLPEYRDRNRLRVVGAEWRPTERYPRLFVENMEPQGEKEKS